LAISSIISAVTVVPSLPSGVYSEAERPDRKDVAKWVKTGERRSSSSNRGRFLAVSYMLAGRQAESEPASEGEGWMRLTSLVGAGVGEA
jgi:hypothetical protein